MSGINVSEVKKILEERGYILDLVMYEQGCPEPCVIRYGSKDKPSEFELSGKSYKKIVDEIEKMPIIEQNKLFKQLTII